MRAPCGPLSRRATLPQATLSTGRDGALRPGPEAGISALGWRRGWPPRRSGWSVGRSVGRLGTGRSEAGQESSSPGGSHPGNTQGPAVSPGSGDIRGLSTPPPWLWKASSPLPRQAEDRLPERPCPVDGSFPSQVLSSGGSRRCFTCSSASEKTRWMEDLRRAVQPSKVKAALPSLPPFSLSPPHSPLPALPLFSSHTHMGSHPPA